MARSARIEGCASCWNSQAMAALQGHVDDEGRLTNAGFTMALSKGTPAYEACEILLKGPEMGPAGGYLVSGCPGSKRKRCRPAGGTLRPTPRALPVPRRTLPDNCPMASPRRHRDFVGRFQASVLRLEAHFRHRNRRRRTPPLAIEKSRQVNLLDVRGCKVPRAPG
jgi:hypothetical protein